MEGVEASSPYSRCDLATESRYSHFTDAITARAVPSGALEVLRAQPCLPVARQHWGTSFRAVDEASSAVNGASSTNSKTVAFSRFPTQHPGAESLARHTDL